MKYRCRYEYHTDVGYPRHYWIVISRHGAVHFRVTDLGEEWAKTHGDRYSGGLEFHYRSPPEYLKDNAPSQDKCWILKAPCWHDGTSLYASESLVPFWLMDPHNHKRMFERLQQEAERLAE